MLLTRFNVQSPVFRMKTKVQHSTPRTATAIERGLLRLHSQLSSRQEWANRAIGDAFTQVFGMPEPGFLVRPALEGLQHLGVLQLQTEESDLSHAPLSALKYLERGKSMLVENKIPGKPKTHRVEHVYDPITHSLLAQKHSAGISEKLSGPFLDAERWLEQYPELLIREQLSKEKHEWLKPQTQLDSLELDARELLWRILKVELHLRADGSLRYQFQSPSHHSYVEQLSEEEVWESLVKPALKGRFGDELPAFPDTWMQAQELNTVASSLFPMYELRLPQNLSGKVCFVRPVPDLLNVPSPKKGQLVVVEDAYRSGELEWTPQGGVTLCVSSLPLHPSILLLGGDRTAVGWTTTEVRLGPYGSALTLGYRQKDALSKDELHQLWKGLDEWLEPSSTIRVLWEKPNNVFTALFDELEATLSPHNLDDTLQSLLQSYEQARLFGMTPSSNFYHNGLSLLFLSWLELQKGSAGSSALLSPRRMRTALGYVARASLNQSGSFDELLPSLLDELPHPTTLEELKHLRGTLEPLLSKEVLPELEAIYSLELLHCLLEEVGRETLFLGLRGGNEVEDTLLQLEWVAKELKAPWDELDKSTLNAENWLDALSPSEQNRLRKQCSLWETAFQKGRTHPWLGPAIEMIEAGSYLMEWKQRVFRLGAQLEQTEKRAAGTNRSKPNQSGRKKSSQAAQPNQRSSQGKRAHKQRSSKSNRKKR